MLQYAEQLLQNPHPVPGDEGRPTIKNQQCFNVRVQDVPVLVGGTAVHPRKPLDGLSLVNVSGTCGKGIFLATVRKARLRARSAAGFGGPLLSTSNVTGTNLAGAAAIEPPRLPDPVPPPYKLG